MPLLQDLARNRGVQQAQQPAAGGGGFGPGYETELPKGAVDWLPAPEGSDQPHGEAYYGPGVEGWAKKTFYQLFDPEKYKPEMDIKKGMTDTEAQANQQEDIEKGERIGAGFAELVAEKVPVTDKYKDYMKDAFTSIAYIGQEPTKAAKFTGNFIKTALFQGVFEAFRVTMEVPFRKAFSAKAAIDEISDNYLVAPKKYGDWRDIIIGQSTPNTVKNSLLIQNNGKMNAWDNAVVAASYIPVIGQVIEGIEVKKTYDQLSEQEKKVFDANLAASNMVYTAWSDEAIKYEAIRRIEQGENPDYVMAELANPWAELAGSLVYDFSNIIGLAGKLTRTTGKAARYANKADTFIKPVQSIVEAFKPVANAADEVDAAVKLKPALKSIIDMESKITAEFGQYLDRLGAIPTKLTDAIFSPTASAKRAAIMDEVGGWTNMVFAAFKDNPEKGAEFMADILKLSSKNVDEALDAAMRINNSPLKNAAFSKAAYEARALLRNVAGDDLTKFTREITDLARKGDLEKVVAYATKKLSDATAQIAPDLKTAEAAFKAVQAGSDKADDIALAARYEVIKDGAKGYATALSRFERAINKGVFGIGYDNLNRMFANLYMGYSPGYVMRNIITNSFGILTDMGAGTAAKSVAAQGEALFKPGKLNERLANDIVDWLGVMPDWAEAGIGAAKDVGGKASAIGLMKGQATEAAASRVIVREAIVREMQRAIKNGALPDTSLLVKNGMPQKYADNMMRMVMDHKGNINKVLGIIRDEIKVGVSDDWRKIAIDPKLSQSLNATGLALMDELRDVLQNHKTLDEFTRGINRIRESLVELASRSAYETPVIDASLDEATALISNAVDDVANAMGRNSDWVTKGGKELFDAKLISSRNMKSEIERLATSFHSDIITKDPNLRQIAETLRNGISNAGLKRDELYKVQTAFLKRVREAYDLALKGKFDEIGEIAVPNIIGNTPAQVFKPGQNYIDDLWNFYKDTSSKMWDDYTEYYADFALDGIKSVSEKHGVQVSTPALVDSIRLQMEEYKKLASSVSLTDYTTELVGNRQFAFNIADQYGIVAKGEEGGKAYNIILRTINKYLPEGTEKFDNLNDVPPMIAALAFEKRAAEKGAEVVTEAAQTTGKGVFSGIDLDKFKRNVSETTSGLDAGRIEALKARLSREVRNKVGVSKEAADFVFDGFQDEAKFRDVAHLNGIPNSYDAPVETILDALRKKMQDRVGEGVDIRKAYDDAVAKFDLQGRMSTNVSEQAARNAELRAQAMKDAVSAASEDVKPVPTDAPSIPNATKLALEDMVSRLRNLERQVVANYGKQTPMFTNPALEKTLDQWGNVANTKIFEARAYASVVARSERDFALLNYGDKAYFDVALSKLMPYHFWYTRTYANWAKRLASNPQIVTAYAKYRRTLEAAHAGMPEWWKYNLSTNDLPGVDVENPIYFNLEATLNPLNGLTGVDFNDSNKRVTWYARMVDDMGKFGPSLFTPINWLVAAGLYTQGEEEAAQRWAGRLIPQTQVLKSALSLANIETPLSYNEFDPFVRMFSGGIDPYERRRVGRALGAMVDNGTITQEQAIEAARLQDGDIWKQAAEFAQDERAGGNLASFFGGVGFRARNASDIEIDRFYTDYFSLINMRPNMSPLEYRNAMTQMRNQYPFMDAVLLSRRDADTRDGSYAYNVLSRIPPGASTDLLNAAGIDNQAIERFYNDKGDFTMWSTSERDRFMAGMVDLGATLAIPQNATQYEWNRAKDAYQQMRAGLEDAFGENIYDLVDEFYALDKGDRDAFIARYPQVKQVLDYQTQIIANNPILYPYYGGIDTLERYYKNQMYNDLYQKYGEDISQKWDEYYNLKDVDIKQANAYYKAHPELKAYSKAKTEMQDEINRRLVEFGSKMPEGKPAEIRPDAPQGTQTLENIYGQVQQPQYTWEQFQGVLSEPLQNLLLAYWTEGEQLPSAAQDRLDYLAGDLGFASGDDLLIAIGMSLR